MRRLSLSAKLFVAAVPLLLALGALLALSTRESFGEVSEARRGAQLGSIWEPLITAISSIESEQTVAESGSTAEANNDARRITNEVMVDLNARLLDIGDSHPLVLQVGQAMTALGLAREGVDNPDMAAARRVSAAASFDQAENELITLGRLLPAEAGDVDLGRELTAVAALAETEQALTSFVEEIARNETQPAAEMDLEPAAFHASAMTEAANLFQAVAPEDWRERYRESGFARALNDGRRALEQLQTYDPASGASRPDIDVARLTAPTTEIGPFRDALATEAVERADTHAESLQRSTWWRTGITLGAVLIAFLMAWIITRSITRRVRRVKDKANEVADTQLPALVSALNDPRSQGTLPHVAPIEDRGADEVAELAGAFNAVQATLVS
ncbi:MAG TPA: HAMP domain-containing protein, partial [Ilumatobacteraceae bacterium]